MLDKTMTYSSGIFLKKTDSLYQAQVNKYESMCRKLDLQPTDHLLEIGTGWGGFAVHAAKKYKCKVTTVTISKQQFEYARALIKKEKLENKIDLQFKDYRDIKGKFDKIASIEMVEALGYKYFDQYFKKCASLIKPDGLIAIQSINFPDPYYQKYLRKKDFIQKYIFPGSVLLSLKEIFKSLDRTSHLMVWDVESMGLHYSRTLTEWETNYWKNLPEIEKLGFDEKFTRKWIFYLAYCRVGFINSYINVTQFVLANPLNKSLRNYNGLGNMSNPN
jgi:cyclopropane-fatty-acyl-phospholipid synthase